MAGLPLATARPTTTYPRDDMNDPLRSLRERLPDSGKRPRRRADLDARRPDALQMLTAKLLFFTGLGTALEALQHGAPWSERDDGWPHRHTLEARPITWAPAVLGAAAATAHAVHAFTSTERTRLATRTFDVAVVAVGLLGLAETLAAARRDRALPDVASVSLASAGLLGLLIDRSEAQHVEELRRLARRANVVARLVPRRRARLDRIVVHV